MKQGKKNPDPRAERPVSAQPVGSTYMVETHGLHHRQRTPKKVEDVSDNFIEHDNGCFRRVPTCKE